MKRQYDELQQRDGQYQLLQQQQQGHPNLLMKDSARKPLTYEGTILQIAFDPDDDLAAIRGEN